MQLNPFSAFQTAFQARGAQLACAAINHLLKQEPTVQAHLKPHAERTVLLRWEAMALVPAGEQCFRIQSDCLLQPCLTHSTATDVTVALKAGLLQAPAAERLRYIRIEGDVFLAQDLSLVAKQLRWDAEHDLARVIGDVPAYWVASNAKKVVNLFEQAAVQCQMRAAQAMTGNSGWALGAAQMQTHQAELAALQTRVDALAARINQVAKP